MRYVEYMQTARVPMELVGTTCLRLSVDLYGFQA